MKTDLFPSYDHFCVFQICWHIDWNTLTASSFRSLNSSAGIWSLPLCSWQCFLRASAVTLVLKNPPTNAGRCKRWVCNTWFKRSPGGGHSKPFQYSCLENPMDREPARLQSIGSHRVGHDWSDLAPASYSIVRWAGDGEGVSLKHMHQGGKQGIAPEVLDIRSCPMFLRLYLSPSSFWKRLYQ